MTYNLLYSRQRQNSDPVIFDDVPVTQASIMIDALSVLSQFKRSCGWVYPVRRATPQSFERGQGRLLLFGKTRCIFPDFAPPYYLEFFPKIGVGTYILSVYTGEPAPPEPHPWVPYPPSQREFKFFPSETKIKTRLISDGSAQFDAYEFSEGGYIFQNYLYSRFTPFGYQKLEIGRWSPTVSITEAEYLSGLSDPSAFPL